MAANDAEVFLAIQYFLAPYPVGVDDFVFGVAQQGVGQFLFRLPFRQGGGRIGADADHSRASLGYFWKSVAKAAGLLSAAARAGFWKEKQQNPLAREIRERNGSILITDQR